MHHLLAANETKSKLLATRNTNIVVACIFTVDHQPHFDYLLYSQVIDVYVDYTAGSSLSMELRIRISKVSYLLPREF